MSVVKNARWIIAESDPMKQVEIVYDDIDCKYASTSDDDGWSDSVNRNANPERIHSQAMMRYNQIFTQVVELTIPLNTNLTAGGIIRCVFPKLAQSKRGEPDPELSGLYMIKELAHYFDGNGSYSKLKVVRDSFGRK